MKLYLKFFGDSHMYFQLGVRRMARLATEIKALNAEVLLRLQSGSMANLSKNQIGAV
jgi:hypothetical protein